VYLLTERSRLVDEGGTWGIPGGAIHDGEPAEAAARREAAEEIWPLPPYRVTRVDVQDCGGGCPRRECLFSSELSSFLHGGEPGPGR
jgi:8-oxo-dGTP pyrophosphatase MutT (NUDIX family)